MTDLESRKLWCGNLSDQITEEILYELFLQAGPVTSITIPKEKDGRPRSYAFIEFKHDCTVPYALQLFDGTSLFNKKLNLKSRQHPLAHYEPVFPPDEMPSFEVAPPRSHQPFLTPTSAVLMTPALLPTPLSHMTPPQYLNYPSMMIHAAHSSVPSRWDTPPPRPPTSYSDDKRSSYCYDKRTERRRDGGYSRTPSSHHHDKYDHDRQDSRYRLEMKRRR